MANWNITIKGIAALQDRHRRGEIEYEQMRDRTVKILRRHLAKWLDPETPDFDDECYEAVEYMAEASNCVYEDAQSDLYDWCDDHLVWIDPIK